MNDPKQTLERDARLLEQALREDWPRQDPRLRDLLERRPQWVELLDRPDAPSASWAAPDDLDRKLTDELLALARRREQRRATPRRRGWGSPWRLAAAALALLFAGALLGRTWMERGGDGAVEVLGSDAQAPRVDSLSPQGIVANVGVFTWSCERPLQAGESFLVILRDVAGDGRPGNLLLQRTTTQTTWTPDAFDLADLPPRFHWSVQWVSATGVAGPAASAFVERSAH